MTYTVERVTMVNAAGQVEDLDFWPRVNALIQSLDERNARCCALVCDSIPEFLIGLAALICSGRTTVLGTSSVSARGEPDTDVLITDHAPSANDDGTLAVPAAGSPGDGHPRAFDDAGEIIFRTSGSTGEPGRVRRSVALLRAEGSAMQATFGARVATPMVAITVPLHHRFGLVAGILWHLMAGHPFYAGKCNTLESLHAALTVHRAVIVSSPTFLGGLRELGQTLPAARVEAIFSAGAPVSDDLAAWLHRHCGAAPIEIYGSTEMGGVAWRQWSPDRGQMAWQAYPGTQSEIHPDVHGDRLHVRAPYTDGWMVADDFVHRTGSGFTLLGRVDSVVKVADKRVSLADMQDRLRGHPWMADARVVLVPASRPRLGVVAVLSPDGQAQLMHRGRRPVTEALRAFLADHFEPVLVPRKWRFINRWPDDPMGKVKREFLLGVLDQPA